MIFWTKTNIWTLHLQSQVIARAWKTYSRRYLLVSSAFSKLNLFRRRKSWMIFAICEQCSFRNNDHEDLSKVFIFLLVFQQTCTFKAQICKIWFSTWSNLNNARDYKVQMFWGGHTIWNNLQLFLMNVKSARFFQMVLALSEYLNFNGNKWWRNIVQKRYCSYLLGNFDNYCLKLYDSKIMFLSTCPPFANIFSEVISSLKLGQDNVFMPKCSSCGARFLRIRICFFNRSVICKLAESALKRGQNRFEFAFSYI